MDQKAIKLCSAFSRQPNSLGYCGRHSAAQAFYACLQNNDCSQVVTEVSHFIVLYPYLKTIGQITRQDPFSYQVVEAFWLGNEFLNQCHPHHFSVLLENLQTQGVPQILIEEIAANPPKIFIPIHLFNIIHIGVGKASGSVPFTLNSINQCMIRWGKVVKLNNHTTLHANLYSLSANYSLISQSETLTFDPNLISNLKVGDTIAAHWGSVAKKLNRREVAQLSDWTNRFLAAL